MAFTELEIEERNLETEVLRNPEALEKGLKILDHQVPAGRGKIDVLAADSANTLTIIELKVNEEDGMLMQALEYFDWVAQNSDRLAERYRAKYTKVRINADESPRIMLVAPAFSETLRTCCKYVDVKIDLLSYIYLSTNKGERGLVCKRVKVEPPAGPPQEPLDVKDHTDYITNPEMRSFCKEIVERIKKIGDDIEVKPIGWALSFKYANRVLAYIQTRREFFWIYYPKGRSWAWADIAKKRDFTSDIQEGIADFYHKLKRE